MQQSQNFILKLFLFILIATTWMYQLPEVNAQASSFKQQGPTTKFQTPNSKLHSTFCLPVTDNCSLPNAQQEQVLDFTPFHFAPLDLTEMYEISQNSIANNQYRHCAELRLFFGERNEELATNRVEKPHSEPRSSRQAPRLYTSRYSALPKTLNLEPGTFNQVTDSSLNKTTYYQIHHFERREGAPATERSREASAQHYQVLDSSPIKCIGARRTDEWLYTSLRAESRSRYLTRTSSRQARTDVIQNSSFQFSTFLITGHGSNLPFHLHTNRLGTVDPGSTNFLNRIQATGNLYKTDNFRVDYGVDLALRISENSTAFFPEIYAGAEYRAFRLDFGRFDRPIGLNNHDLSIGSMMVSRNAVPIPRVMLSTPKFTAVPWTNNILEFKAMYSHGWFTDERYVNDAYLHQKYLYMKVNFKPISLIGGIVHNAMWGGTSPDYGRFPQSFDDYLKIIFANAADPGPNVPQGFVDNALGNSLAAYEFGVNFDNEDLNLSITRLFYLEDSVSKRFRSPWDGVWGLNLKFKDEEKFLSAVTYEHIYTKRQDSRSDEEWGRSSYYNHFVYQTGWSNYGRVIGIPLFTFDKANGEIGNNIVVGHHIAFSGQFNKHLKYQTHFTYSRNYGTGLWKVPKGTIDWADRRADQLSFLVSLNYTLPAISTLTITTNIGFDLGEFYDDSFGSLIEIKYRF